MNSPHLTTAWKIAALLALSLCLAACNGSESTPTPSGNTPGAPTQPGDTPAATPTDLLPSATPLPLAARVNGEGLSLAEFESELARYQASGTNLATDAQQAVLDELIAQVLLAQAAAENGFVVDEALLQTRLEALAAQLGGVQALSDWMAANGYSQADFEAALARSIAAAWMRDQIIAAVPETADQAHVRQILLYNLDQANQVYQALQSGSDFASLAAQYDPQTGGDLGWFPQGYLTEPAIEAAAFALEPGAYSTVIETRLGYHLIQLIERESNRLLLPPMRQALQTQALSQWLEERRSQSEIQIMLP